MNSNQIKNQKVKVLTGIKLNDKDYLNSLLSRLKEMNKNYAVALTESSNEYLFEQYKIMFDNCGLLQRQVYETMFRKGWYIVEIVDDQKIKQKYQCLNQELMDLNN